MRTWRLIIGAVLVGICAAATGCQEQQRRKELQAGFAALDSGDYVSAMAAADAFVDGAPRGYGAAEGRYLRGRALEQRPKSDDRAADADLEAAVGEYQKSLELHPSRQLEGYIRASLGNVGYWMNDYAAAEGQFASAFDRLDDDGLKAWVLYRIGLCQQRQGHWAPADESFVRVQKEYSGTEAAARAALHQGARAFYVQVSAFLNATTADRLVSTLKRQGMPALSTFKQDRNLHIVLVGPIQNYVAAMGWRNRVSAQFKDAMIIP